MKGGGIVGEDAVWGAKPGTEPSEGGHEILSLLGRSDLKGDCSCRETGEQHDISSSKGAAGEAVGPSEINACEMKGASWADSGKMDSRGSWRITRGFMYHSTSETTADSFGDGLAHTRHPKVFSESGEKSIGTAMLE